MKRVFILIFLLLILFGCKKVNDKVELDQVTNIDLDGLMLSWDEVNNATKYRVTLNDEIIYTNNNYLLVEKEGEYQVTIIASAPNYLDSVPSDIFTFTINFVKEVEFNLSYDQETKVISWEYVLGVESYMLYINNNIYKVDNNSFSYENTPAGLLKVRVQGVYPIGFTYSSEDIYIEHNLKDVTINYQYSTNSSKNIKILNIDTTNYEIFSLDNKKIDKDILILEGDYLEIKSSFIISISSNEISFYLYTGTYKYLINIKINNKTEGYLITSSQVTRNNQETISFLFELFGESFKQISSPGLTSNDYVIDGDIVTFKKEYLDRVLSDANEVSITYSINGEVMIIGLLKIIK